MNMKTALRKLYKAISGEDNYKVNTSKLLVDIHKALTNKEPVNKNNHARIISELADNWTGGGGGSSDFSTAVVTITGIGEGTTVPIIGCYCFNDYNLLLPFTEIGDGVYTVPLYKGTVVFLPDQDLVYTLSGNATDNDGIFITGDCTITIS